MIEENKVNDKKYRSWFSIFVNSLKENDEDFTTAPIKYALPLLAIPMMIELSMEAIFAVVDITFVSFLGTDAVAAVAAAVGVDIVAAIVVVQVLVGV